MKNEIEKLKINVTEEQMKNPSIAYDVAVRKKINELIEFTDERTLRRDQQIENLKAEIKDFKRELMEYHNLLLKQKDGLKNFTSILKKSSELFEILSEDVIKIKKELKIV